MAVCGGKTVRSDLFKDVQFYCIDNTSDQVKKLLIEGGAKENQYLSQLISVAISDDPNRSEVEEAIDLLDVPVVTSRWIVLSAKCGVLLPKNGFRPQVDQLFSGVVACPSQLSQADKNTIWAMITFNGGRYQTSLDKTCTHLITTKPQGTKYAAALEHKESIRIVTPDWVYECTRAQKRLDADIYHPKLVVPPKEASPQPKMVVTSTAASPLKAMSFLEEINCRLDMAVEPRVPIGTQRQVRVNTAMPLSAAKSISTDSKIGVLSATLTATTLDKTTSNVSAKQQDTQLPTPLMPPPTPRLKLPTDVPPLQMKSSQWMTQQMQGAFGQPPTPGTPLPPLSPQLEPEKELGARWANPINEEQPQKAPIVPQQQLQQPKVAPPEAIQQPQQHGSWQQPQQHEVQQRPQLPLNQNQLQQLTQQQRMQNLVLHNRQQLLHSQRLMGPSWPRQMGVSPQDGGTTQFIGQPQTQQIPPGPRQIMVPRGTSPVTQQVPNWSVVRGQNPQQQQQQLQLKQQQWQQQQLEQTTNMQQQVATLQSQQVILKPQQPGTPHQQIAQPLSQQQQIGQPLPQQQQQIGQPLPQQQQQIGQPLPQQQQQIGQPLPQQQQQIGQPLPQQQQQIGQMLPQQQQQQQIGQMLPQQQQIGQPLLQQQQVGQPLPQQQQLGQPMSQQQQQLLQQQQQMGQARPMQQQQLGQQRPLQQQLGQPRPLRQQQMVQLTQQQMGHTLLQQQQLRKPLPHQQLGQPLPQQHQLRQALPQQQLGHSMPQQLRQPLHQHIRQPPPQQQLVQSMSQQQLSQPTPQQSQQLGQPLTQQLGQVLLQQQQRGQPLTQQIRQSLPQQLGQQRPQQQLGQQQLGQPRHPQPLSQQQQQMLHERQMQQQQQQFANAKLQVSQQQSQSQEQAPHVGPPQQLRNEAGCQMIQQQGQPQLRRDNMQTATQQTIGWQQSGQQLKPVQWAPQQQQQQPPVNMQQQREMLVQAQQPQVRWQAPQTVGRDPQQAQHLLQQQQQGQSPVQMQAQQRQLAPQRMLVNAQGLQPAAIPLRLPEGQQVQVRQVAPAVVQQQPQQSAAPNQQSINQTAGTLQNQPRDSLQQAVQMGQEQIRQQLQSLANQMQPQVVTPKTKTALANLLNNRLQGTQRMPDGNEIVPAPIVVPRLPVPQAPVPQPSGPNVEQSAEYQRTLRNITNNGQQPVMAPRVNAGKPQNFRLAMPSGNGQSAPVPRVQFYGHDPVMRIPPDLCLLGCIFHFVDYDKLVTTDKLESWKKVIFHNGGEVETDYSAKCTHVMCDNQRNSIVQQAMREGKRCVTAHWLNDILIKKKMSPPWLALHFPTPFSEEKPCKSEIITVSNFEGEERLWLKYMITSTGAKYTGYMSRCNTKLICKRPEGDKYETARDWKIPNVNVQWLQDILLGHYESLRLPSAPKYQQFNVANPFNVDYALVPHLMTAWRVPIRVSEETWKKFIPNPDALTKLIQERSKRKLDNEPNNVHKRNRSSPELDENVAVTTRFPPDDSNRPIVLFTGMKGTTEMARKVQELGGSVAKTYKECTHLVADTLCRTVKYLCAISVCKYVVTKSWILESAKQNRFIDEVSHILIDVPNENHFGCNIKFALLQKRKGPLFKEFTFYMTPGVKPCPIVLKEIIECAGGTVATKRPSTKEFIDKNQNSQRLILISCENDIHLCTNFFKKNINVYNVEFILTAVMRQDVDYESFVIAHIQQSDQN